MRFGPTGVDFFDVLGAFVVILVVTQAVDGFGNLDSLAPAMGAGAAFAVFAPAAFGTQAAVGWQRLVEISQSASVTHGQA